MRTLRLKQREENSNLQRIAHCGQVLVRMNFQRMVFTQQVPPPRSHESNDRSMCASVALVRASFVVRSPCIELLAAAVDDRSASAVHHGNQHLAPLTSYYSVRTYSFSPYSQVTDVRIRCPCMRRG